MMTGRAPIKPGVGNGVWGVVALGFMTLALAFTIRGSLSLAMPVWQAEFGWSRGYISGIAAIALIVMAVVGPSREDWSTGVAVTVAGPWMVAAV